MNRQTDRQTDRRTHRHSLLPPVEIHRIIFDNTTYLHDTITYKEITN